MYCTLFDRYKLLLYTAPFLLRKLCRCSGYWIYRQRVINQAKSAENYYNALILYYWLLRVHCASMFVLSVSLRSGGGSLHMFRLLLLCTRLGTHGRFWTRMNSVLDNMTNKIKRVVVSLANKIKSASYSVVN